MMETGRGMIKPSEELVKTNSGTISRNSAPISIGTLELRLLERYPVADAESWDRMGLLAGDPTALVTKVLVALDPTAFSIDAAMHAGANVLLSHHPVFLEPPCEFKPLDTTCSLPGSLVASALQEGVSLINLHTALDCSSEANRLLPSLLNLECVRVLAPRESDCAKGYGQICWPTDGKPIKLEHLAARCLSVFGSVPRVWGAPGDLVQNIAVVNGSAGSLLDDCIKVHADCLICGELHYHQALEALQKGMAIIELGHDVSEFPLLALLAQAAIAAGVPSEKVLVYEEVPRWFTPEATRV